MTIRMSNLLAEITSDKLDVLLEGRRKSMHRTSHASQAAREAGQRLQGGETPETLGHRAREEAKAQRARELARLERERRQGKPSDTEAAILAAQAEFNRQMEKDKPVPGTRLPNLSKVDIATQIPDDEDTFLAPPSGMRRRRDSGQDGDEDTQFTPDQLGSKGRLGMDESTHDTDEEHAKEMQRNIKRYETGGTAAHKAALAAARAAARAAAKRKKGAK